jgi:reverse gyrase
MSWKEINYLFPAFFLLIISKIAIKLLPINFLQKKFQKLTKNHNKLFIDDIDLVLKAKSINRIANVFSFLGFGCLPKALAFKYWSKKYYGLKVNFGVQKDTKNKLIAHAWISKGDKIILGEDPSINYKSIWIWE